MQYANIPLGSSLETPSTTAYNVGTGDFTVLATMQSTQGGALAARKSATGPSVGGFGLRIDSAGVVEFVTDNGVDYHEVLTAASGILDGCLHTVAGIRRNGVLSIVIDGILAPTTGKGSTTASVNMDSNLPLTIGRSWSAQQPLWPFAGQMLNVSMWSAALSDDALVEAAFARVSRTSANLLGYWTLDGTFDDISPNGNTLTAIGAVTFEPCLDCVWTHGTQDFVFCEMANTADPQSSAIVTQAMPLNVPSGAPSLAMSVMANQDLPDFPSGIQVTLSDPAGTVYDQAQNTTAAFVSTRWGQPWAVMISNPPPGIWRIAVTAPVATGFHLNVQTVPAGAVVQTCRQALEPLFGSIQPIGRQHWSRELGGFWEWVAMVAVAAVVGVIAAAAVVATGGAALPAVAAGLFFFAGVGLTEAAIVLPTMNNNSVRTTSQEVSGMAGFVVSPDPYVLMDANVAADPATQLIYQQRDRQLYPKVIASSCNKRHQELVGSKMKRAAVKTMLESFDSGYVTMNGHGRTNYVLGWYVSGTTGPMEEVLASAAGSRHFSAKEAKGKIFHLYACNCGYTGTATSPGLGQDLITNGAIAFFGYNVAYQLRTDLAAEFCACDIEIDVQMIAGMTCDYAFNQSIALYNSTITNLRTRGLTQAAASLEINRNALVSPSTSSIFGDKLARIKIS